MPHHHTLNRRQVHRSATRHLQEHVPLRDYKRKVTPSTLWAVVLTAAAGVTSIHATFGWLKELPSEETVRKALYACLPDFAELAQTQRSCYEGQSRVHDFAEVPKGEKKRLRRAVRAWKWPQIPRDFVSQTRKRNSPSVDAGRKCQTRQNFFYFAPGNMIVGLRPKRAFRRCRQGRRCTTALTRD